MLVSIIAGARPNFMKIAPIIAAIQVARQQGAIIDFRLIHTGQHYDARLSDTFFEQLEIPLPHTNLEAGSGTQAQQTAQIMVRFEEELTQHPATVVLVVGDVNSTMACAIVAKKMQISVVHVEAGIRSFDISMPEEINRMVTDAICDHFFTTSEVANQNLLHEGHLPQTIHWVGNTMIDTLLKNLPKLRSPECFFENNLAENNYMVLTLHRPANVDNAQNLGKVLAEIEKNSTVPVVFPVHPRTRKKLQELSLNPTKIILTEPLGYHQFIYLVKNSQAVITDSGGIQEETTVLGVPCITLRNNTERPETVSIGTNVLIGTNPESIAPALQQISAGTWKKGGIPPLWDGKTATRIVAKLLDIYELAVIEQKLTTDKVN